MSEPGSRVFVGPLIATDGPFVFNGTWVKECDEESPEICTEPLLVSWSAVHPFHHDLPRVARALEEAGENARAIVLTSEQFAVLNDSLYFHTHPDDRPDTEEIAQGQALITVIRNQVVPNHAPSPEGVE